MPPMQNCSQPPANSPLQQAGRAQRAWRLRPDGCGRLLSAYPVRLADGREGAP
jgi:hypothetical protein